MKFLVLGLLLFSSMSFAQSLPTENLWEGEYSSNDPDCESHLLIQHESWNNNTMSCPNNTFYTLKVYLQGDSSSMIPSLEQRDLFAINCGPFEQGRGDTILKDNIYVTKLVQEDDSEVIYKKIGTIGILRIPIYTSEMTIRNYYDGHMTWTEKGKTCLYQKEQAQ